MVVLLSRPAVVPLSHPAVVPLSHREVVPLSPPEVALVEQAHRPPLNYNKRPARVPQGQGSLDQRTPVREPSPGLIPMTRRGCSSKPVQELAQAQE